MLPLSHKYLEMHGSDYPGTLSDTYTNVNTDINADSEEIRTYSWAPYPANSCQYYRYEGRFELIPDYATVFDATLYLYQSGASGESQYVNTIHIISGKNAIVSQVTGYNAFNGEPWTPVADGTTYNDIPFRIG